MPGKKDPEYFPLNFNMEIYDYDYEEDDYETEGSTSSFPVNLPGMYNESDGNNKTRRTRNVSFNEMFVPPENSEVEEDEETASVQSSDIDVDEDVVDTLVLSIREKLRMGPKFNVNVGTSSHSPGAPANFWNETPSPSPYDSNNSGCSSSSKRFRVHPYFSSPSWKATNRPNLGGIQKSNTGKAQVHHWWRSFSDISHRRRGKSNPDSPSVDDPYHLLQELVDSGSLIKEAVRRIKTKRLGCVKRSNNNSTSSSSNHNSLLSPGSSSTLRRFTYRDEESENSYPTLPLSAQ